MKRLFFVILISLGLGAFLNAETFNLHKGWNLIGNSNSIDVSTISSMKTIYEFHGNIFDDNNNSIKEAKVLLQLRDKNITVISNIKGEYNLKIDENITFPVLVTVSKDGYIPVSKNFYKKDNLKKYYQNFQFQKQTENVVIIDKTLHHLGDNIYAGTINSQFQAKSEGINYKKSFDLNQTSIKNYNNAELIIYVKGAQYVNRIYINGKFISYLNKSPEDGSFGVYSFNVPLNILEAHNLLEIYSYKNGDYDDFEFANIQFNMKK